MNQLLGLVYDVRCRGIFRTRLIQGIDLAKLGKVIVELFTNVNERGVRCGYRQWGPIHSTTHETVTLQSGESGKWAREAN